ncbi:MAG: hypothetical protein HC824_13745 [Synechococcales cyanobacterium RM1_1_8]|nr:hypothetical protein [Synechococcales cyanobacterium RM1_1_8]
MPREKLVVVAGAPGAGKTAWIVQQLQQYEAPRQTPAHRPLYCALGGADIPLDAVFLGAQSLGVEVLPKADLSRVAIALQAGRPVFLEIHGTIELDSLDLHSQLLAHWEAGSEKPLLERVAIVPEGWRCDDLESWSDRRFPSPIAFPPPPSSPAPQQIWSLDLTGQVFDPPSLDLLWQELTGGAYGQVQRAKGIFCLADGSGFFFSFVPAPPGQPPHKPTANWPLSPSPRGDRTIPVA